MHWITHWMGNLLMVIGGAVVCVRAVRVCVVLGDCILDRVNQHMDETAAALGIRRL